MMRSPAILRAIVVTLLCTASMGATASACSDEPAAQLPDAALGRGDSAVVLPDGSGGDASDAGDASNERDPCAPIGPPLCSPSAAWEAPTAVLSSPTARLAAVTPDELHLAYFEADDAGTTLAVSDRASTADAFPPGRAFGYPTDATGASLSKDGLLLLVTQAQRPRLASRPASGEPFGVPDNAAFQFGDEGQLYRGPVFLENGGFFLTTTNASVGQMAFTLVDKVAGVYLLQTPVYPQAELENTSDGGFAVKSPTGMSKDLRTLFFYDEEAKTTKAAFRPAPGCAYTTFVDLGNRPFATPNATCTALYYRDPSTGLGVLRAARKP